MKISCADGMKGIGYRLFAGSLALLGLAMLSPLAIADSPIVRVEEDWEMVVETPDVASVGPQIVSAFSPTENLDGTYASFELNHSSFPDFSRGGLHLHVWDGVTNVASRTFANTNILATNGETVRWTQRMEVKNGQVIFGVCNGHSVTWGDFGNEGTLNATSSCTVANLNGYSPEISIKNSGVTFAGNRVRSLILRSVRVFREDDTVVSLALNRVVHELTQ